MTRFLEASVVKSEMFPTAVALDLEVWSRWIKGASFFENKQKSSAGAWSFQSHSSSVDGEAQDGDDSRAQRHSQPEGCVAHV